MYRRRWYVVGVWLIVFLVAGVGAAKVGSVLGAGDFTQKGSESAKAAELLDKQLHQNGMKLTMVVVQSKTQTVHDEAFVKTVARITERVRGDRALHITRLDNPLVSHTRGLVSTDGRAVAITVASSLSEPKIEDQIDHLRERVRSPGYSTYVVGAAASSYDYAISSKDDLARGDAITVPLLIVVLLVVFGTLAAAGLPLLLAAVSITSSLALVFVVGHFVDTSIYVTNVVTLLGLGIGIDYSLFIVYRYREELARTGGDVEAAVVRTMETTGRAVFFSGLTVAIGLSSLILTQLSFMISMGIGGMLVPLTAVIASMTLLPAVLSILGTKINRFRVVPQRFLRADEGHVWHKLALRVMRRPVIAGGAVLLVLLSLVYPATKLEFAFGSLKNAPQAVESVKGVEYMQKHFRSTADPVQIVVRHHGAGDLLSARSLAGIGAIEDTIRHDGDVVGVTGPADFVSDDGSIAPAGRAQLFGQFLSADNKTALITVVGRHETGTKAAEDLVRRLRDVVQNAPGDSLRGDAIYVGGSQAGYTDFNDALYAHFPLIVAIVLVLTYTFLFYAFRSVFLPLKAVGLNLLSVGASYGILQLVFQHGIGSSVLHFYPESGVASWVPIFLFAFLFGLSMDYEVFLLSRIREGWLTTSNNRVAVAGGLERTGRLITSAAAIMVIAFSGFLIGNAIQLKEFGFGLLAAIAFDATLIRLILVPSIMQLMGEWNWWVPSFLADWAARGETFSEGEDVPEPVAFPVPAGSGDPSRMSA